MGPYLQAILEITVSPLRSFGMSHKPSVSSRVVVGVQPKRGSPMETPTGPPLVPTEPVFVHLQGVKWDWLRITAKPRRPRQTGAGGVGTRTWGPSHNGPHLPRAD